MLLILNDCYAPFTVSYCQIKTEIGRHISREKRRRASEDCVPAGKVIKRNNDKLVSNLPLIKINILYKTQSEFLYIEK